MGSSGPGEFAERLRRHREAAALSQEELAAQSGLTAKAIGALERGERRRPYPHTVRARWPTPSTSPPPTAPPSPRRSRPLRRTSTSRRVDLSPCRPLDSSAATRERREVLDLLADGTRLVTLTGPGGVGKTSLALDAARAVSGPVTVVELAALTDAGQVLEAVARALDVRLAGLPAQAIAGTLGGADHLIVLDNLEHLLAAAPDVAELLARCPGLTVLATSRAALRVRAEHEVPLGPLDVPATGRDVETSPAARVFLDRARAAGRPVPLTDESATDVAAICRRLDGLPLALELAAAHARFLTPHQLLDRLDQALGVPRSRDLPERQRTIAATLDWSHDLLTRDEQTLFRRLSVFAGGFDLDAVEAIGGDLATLGGLVEQSLVIAGDDRFRLLEPSGSTPRAEPADRDVADRAAGFYVDPAATARPRTPGTGPGPLAGPAGPRARQPHRVAATPGRAQPARRGRRAARRRLALPRAAQQRRRGSRLGAAGPRRRRQRPGARRRRRGPALRRRRHRRDGPAGHADPRSREHRVRTTNCSPRPSSSPAAPPSSSVTTAAPPSGCARRSASRTGRGPPPTRSWSRASG